jgi:hypothetical protein
MKTVYREVKFRWMSKKMLISIILKYDLDIGRYFETHFIQDDAVDILVWVDERLVYIPFVFVIGYLF